MRTLLPMLMFLVSYSVVFSQTTSFDIEYKGISPDLPSPHRADVNGNVGINNPERGFSIRGGSFDIFSNSDFPNENFQNTIDGNPSVGMEPLYDYLNEFSNDGISLVEIEAYIKYKDDLDSSNISLNGEHISSAINEVPGILKSLGLKSHFILNSSLKYCQNNSDGILNTLEIDGPRFRKNIKYFEEAESLFKQINPYVAVAHLGWIDMPWDFNQYRLSGNWKKSNYAIGVNYPTGNLVNQNTFTNFHGTYKESTQRSSWGGAHSTASVWQYQSAINTLKKDILDKTLNVFKEKKVLLKSTMAVATHIGNSLGITNPVYAVTYPTNHMKNVMSGSTNTTALPNAIKNLKDEDNFLRIGYYEGAFGGDTYSHYWTIGNGKAQEIQWSSDFSSSLGVDWAGNPYYTDVNNLRSYRGNMWMHGEMPVYETEDPINNEEQTLFAYSTSSFNRHHQYYSNWYSNGGSENKQYDYETGEGMSSGRLQDGFYSALKLRYFNFTSFNISHNNLLDGRSPYEMPNGFDYSQDPNGDGPLVGNGIPNAQNTAIMGWKNKNITEQELIEFGMPVSNNYFQNQNGNTGVRTAYDYIRDHLGYRLELQRSSFAYDNTSINFQTHIVNRGFAAPQNKRKIYFVLLNEGNEVMQYSQSEEDWRNWQPDQFSDGVNNATNLQFPVVNSSYNSLDELIIGGIPLGEHDSEWHHSPITSYNPIKYSIKGNFDLSLIEPGYYKMTILLPDNDPSLKNDPNYAVRFANQATYIPCLGATVLGGFNHLGGAFNDVDGDGIVDNVDSDTNIPDVSGYSQDLLYGNIACQSDVSQIFLNPSSDLPSDEISIFPNPADNTIGLISKLNWTRGTISTPEGQFIRYFTNSSNTLDISDLKPGVYMMTLISKDTKETSRFVKK